MNKTGIIIRIIFLTLCLKQVCAQTVTDFEDNERVLVLGIRYIDSLIVVENDVNDCFIITEKKYLEEFVGKDDNFYNNLQYYQPHSYCTMTITETIETLIIPQLNNDTLVDLVRQQLCKNETCIAESKLFGKKYTKYKNLRYRHLNNCRRFLVVLLAEGAMEKYWHVDADPPFTYMEPKWGLYEKYLIPLPIGDTTKID